jgi:hypothetical protein
VPAGAPINRKEQIERARLPFWKASTVILRPTGPGGCAQLHVQGARVLGLEAGVTVLHCFDRRQ